jgi:UPF0271 protein
MLLNCDIGESYGAWAMGLDDQPPAMLKQITSRLPGLAQFW